jgi:uncharacterized damage-inducible protein DinB
MEQLIAMNNGAVDMFFKSVRKMPEDKQTWKPLDTGRSALEQARELATSPHFFLKHINPTHESPYANEEELMAAGTDWDLDTCEQKCREVTATYNEFLKTMTPQQLTQMIPMPWGQEHSGAEIAGFHYWNIVYHQGQVNYIQTLYGDNDMF